MSKIDIELLYKEARKYKSVEEYLKVSKYLLPLVNMDLSYSEELTGAYSGQKDIDLIAKRGEKVVGYIRYSEFQGEPHIVYIKVAEDEKQKGIGSDLVKTLQREYPDKILHWGMLTAEGEILKTSLDKQLIDIYNHANEQSKNKLSEVSQFYIEAQKHNSAAEFIKALGEPLYHGSEKIFETFQEGNNNNFSIPRKGYYFTNNKEVATDFGKNIIEAYVKPNCKIADLRIDADETAQNIYRKIVDSIKTPNTQYPHGVSSATTRGKMQTEEFITAAQKLGYDGIMFSDFWAGKKDWNFDSTVIFDSNNIRTHAQMIQIYSMVNEPLYKEAVKSENFDEYYNKLEKQGKIVYHGSPSADKIIQEGFNTKHAGTRSKHNPEDVGIHFTESKRTAGAYSEEYLKEHYNDIINKMGYLPEGVKAPEGSGTISAYLDIKNPLITKMSKDINSILIKKAKEFGHDGIIATNGALGEPEKEYVIFSTNQIKTKAQLMDIYKQAKGIESGKEQSLTKTTPERQPITTYHGTNDNIKEFDISKASGDVYGSGINFITDNNRAMKNGKYVIESIINLKNPLVLNDVVSKSTVDKIKSLTNIDFTGFDGKIMLGSLQNVWGGKEVRDILQKSGFDGTEYILEDGHKINVVFDTSKITIKTTLSTSSENTSQTVSPNKQIPNYVIPRNTEQSIVHDTKRWEYDRGAIPGEPLAYLDAGEELDNSRAIVVEIDNPSDYKEYMIQGDFGEVGPYLSYDSACAAAEYIVDNCITNIADIMAGEKKRVLHKPMESVINDKIKFTIGYDSYLKDKKMGIALEKVGSVPVSSLYFKDPKELSNIYDYMIKSDREKFIVLSLDENNKLLSTELAGIGIANACIVHPREIFKVPTYLKASSIICIHNHPSGDSTPSDDDLKLTRRLHEAGKLIGIKVLDHIVITDNDYTCINPADTTETHTYNYLSNTSETDINIPQYSVLKVTSNYKDVIFTKPSDVVQFTKDLFSENSNSFIACLMNARNQVVSICINKGPITDEKIMEVNKKMVLSSATSVIYCTNTPVERSVISKLKDNSNTLGIEMLDFLQIKDNGYISAVEKMSFNTWDDKISETKKIYKTDKQLDFIELLAKQDPKENEVSSIIESNKPISPDKPIETPDALLDKDTLTPEELNILLDKTGAGGLEKKGKTGRGLLDEYYTPEVLTKKVWEAIGEHIDAKTPDLSILEPGAGIGGFMENAPEDSAINAFEVNPYAAKVCSVKFPGANVKNEYFESLFIDKHGNKKADAPYNSYDIVIGNPPYGLHRGEYLGLGEEPKIRRYEEYFLKRSLDVCKTGGVVAMVVPSGFLRNKPNSAKEQIAILGELVDAFRLPNSTFPTTDIGTDIVIIRKSASADDSILKTRIEQLSNNQYFINHPDKVIGIEKERPGKYGPEKYVEGSIEDIEKYNFYIDKNITDIQEAKESAEPEEVLVQEVEEAEEEVLPENAVNIKPYTIVVNKGDKVINIQNINKYTELEKELWNNTDALGNINQQFVNKYCYNIEPGDTPSPGTIRTLYSQDVNIDFENTKHGYELRYKNDFNYYQGNIYEKIDSLTNNQDRISPQQYEKQLKKLLEIMPEKAVIKDINLSPIDPIVKDISYGNNTTLTEKFEEYIDLLPHECYEDSSRWDVKSYVNNRPVTGRDKDENENRRKARKEVGNKLFLKFIREEISDEEKAVILDIYNRKRNAIVKQDFANVPITSTINSTFKSTKMKLRDVQLKGIGFLVNKGVGCLAHEVGGGKTLTSIVAVNELLTKGWIKRPLIVVPKSVYKKWINEISDAIPNVKINTLHNLGAQVLKKSPEITIEDGTITIVTTEGFEKLSFKTDTYEWVKKNLNDVIDGYDKKTQRQREKEDADKDVIIGKSKKGTTNLYFEELGFDQVVLDEAHRYKNIFSKAKLEKGHANEYTNVRGASASIRGIKAYVTSQYMLNKNEGRGMFLLTATPFTNSPMEYYSMLSLVARKKMDEMGILNVNDFMSAYMDMKSIYEVKADLSIQSKENIERFRNAQQLRALVSEYFDFKTGDELGVIRPDKYRKTVFLKPSAWQADLMKQAEPLFNDKENGGAMVAITELQNITLSPYLSKYCTTPAKDCKEFVENSPKIYFTLEAMKQVKKDNPDVGQILFMPRGVDYHFYIKEYLVKEMGYKESEVAIVSGKENNKDNELDKISEAFNSGKLKCIIGSDTIKEGMDLQGNTTDLYHLHLPWNPLDLDQVEGRLWRHGNKWSNVRITYPLIENTIDPFIFQKLETKMKRINDLKSKNTNTIEVGELNFEELKFDLITDPVIRLQAEKQYKMSLEYKELTNMKADASFIKLNLDKRDILNKQMLMQESNIHFHESMGRKSNAEYHKNKKEECIQNMKKHENRFSEKDIEAFKEKLAQLNENITQKQKRIDTMDARFDTDIKKAKKEKDNNITNIYIEKYEPSMFSKHIARIEEENKHMFVGWKAVEDNLKQVADISQTYADFKTNMYKQYQSGNIPVVPAIIYNLCKENNDTSLIDRHKLINFEDGGSEESLGRVDFKLKKIFYEHKEETNGISMVREYDNDYFPFYVRNEEVLDTYRGYPLAKELEKEMENTSRIIENIKELNNEQKKIHKDRPYG